MKWVENLGIDDPEKFVVSEESDPPHDHKIGVIYVYIFPFSNVVIIFHSGEVYFEVNEVTDCCEKKSQNDCYSGKSVVYVSLKVVGKGEAEQKAPDSNLQKSWEGSNSGG